MISYITKRCCGSLCILSGEMTGAKTSAENLFSLPICVIMVWVMQMDKEKELPKRKDIRLKNYDYSSAGAYFVTICIKDRKRILSDIIKPSVVPCFN